MKLIPLIIVVAYFILTIVIGVLSNKVKDSRTFHGASLGILMCVAVGAGEWLGGTSTTGVSEYGYLYGISGAWYTIANGLGICFLAVLFAKRFRRMNKPTISGIIGEQIGGKTQLVSCIFQLVIMIAVGVSQMIAVGTIGEALLGISPQLSIIVMGTGVLVYTVLGGMNAVGKTNILHMVVMYAFAIVALVIGLTSVGGFQTLQSNLPSSYFSVGSIGGVKISSWLIASLLGACVAQAGLQPILAAKDEKVAQKSSFIIAAIVAPFGVITSILGMIAKYKFPDLANGKMALPTLVMDMNPVIGGFIIASILAAVLSTAGPIFLSCGTLFNRDVYCTIKKTDEDDKRNLLVSRVATLVFGLICVALAILLYNLQTVLDIVYFAYSLRGSLFVILLLGMYWKRVSPLVCNIAMGVTCAVSLFWIIFKTISGHYPIAPWLSETYVAIFLALFISVIGSLIIKKKELPEGGNDEQEQ